ncbi:hypothetical protein L9F63_011390 [Diploptera punctata]|uniref:Peptidase S54 rhomboid domain-containing protein n=1 Tax=Diploptera punctata TaxID=6984 RepID=A0AAD8AGD4_DIPPU|nr:hypothetical protein L9F63_011390 [Diploptera punctata]
MAEVLVQLIAPEEQLPVCHHEDNKQQQQGILQLVHTWQPPYFILLVSVLEVCIFVWGDSDVQRVLLYDPHHREQIWRFLSYMLLHSDTLHLALNIAIQCLLAAPLEHEQGHVRTAMVYLGGVLAGSLGTSILEPELYMMGASGGVYALLISQLANILLNFKALPYKLHRAVAVAVLALADIAASLYHYFPTGQRVSTDQLGCAL